MGQPLTLAATSIDPGATIENFFSGSKIDLTGVPFVSGSTSASYVDGTLTITTGGTLEDFFQLHGAPDSATFTVASDGASGTAITTDNVPCFVSGTRIRTVRGEVAVEELRTGDLVPVVRAGGFLPIIWIGHRRVRIDRHPRPWDMYPVRVSAGAFADFVPERDLWLSPEHAVFLHGVLVPVRLLLNGTTIVQVPCAEVTYWHVELPSHDLLLCEGAWTESYLDMGNRAAFAEADAAGDGEGAAPVMLHPDFSRESWEARACQQQERGGPVVAAIRQAINARATARAEAA
jgi:collagen type I/II/III/V/XI/XXIV/XXVII alpha